MSLPINPKFISTDMATDAEVAAASTDDRNRANHTGTQTASTISDFTTAVQAVTIDASKIDGGLVDNTEFSYLNGVTSSIQTQINSKQATITGAATTVVSADLTANRALTSDASGKISVSAATLAELAFLSGVTSAIQTQINTIINGGNIDGGSPISLFGGTADIDGGTP